MDELDDFTRAYIECALWSSTDQSRDDGGDPLDKNYDIDDIAPKALETIKKECDDFQVANAKLLSRYYAKLKVDEERAGHDFWLTRNGHGAGFWDRGLGKLGDDLSTACKPYGSCYLYVGDDGKIYVS